MAWLYHAPVDLKILPPSHRADTRMLAFRSESTIQALLRAALRATPNALISSRVKVWLERYERMSWFQRWLLRGENAPSDVRVLTIGELQRFDRAWDYIGILRDAKQNASGSGIDRSMYQRCFREEMFPTEQLAGFVQWLFGGPMPQGWYIVPEWFSSLLQRLTVAGIRQAAELSAGFTGSCKRDATLGQALAEAVRKKGQLGHKDCPAWQSLGDRANERIAQHNLTNGRKNVIYTPIEQQRQCILAYAKHAQLTRALESVGKSYETWTELRAEAALHIGASAARADRQAIMAAARAALDELVQPSLPVSGGPDERAPASGRLAPGLYAPMPWMYSFRIAATNRRREHHISGVRDVPRSAAWQSWMLDSVIPTRQHGRPSQYQKWLDAQQAVGSATPAAATEETAAKKTPPKRESTIERDQRFAKLWDQNHLQYRSKRFMAQQLKMDEATLKKAISRGLKSLGMVDPRGARRSEKCAHGA